MKKSLKDCNVCQTKKKQWVIHESNIERLKLPGTTLTAGDTEVNKTNFLNSQSL